MKSLKIFLLSLYVVSFIPNTTCADDGNTLFYYSKSSMIPMKISLNDLDKITFSNDGIQMWQHNGLSEIPFEDFLLFTFFEIEHPNITNVESSYFPKDILIQYIPNQRMLLIKSGLPLNGINFYDLQGRVIYNEASTATDYRITLPVLPKGVYVVKTIINGKVIVKKIIL